jgi:predicted HNH restriction endonuclease
MISMTAYGASQSAMAGFAPCFECGNPSDHNHHVIPKVYGGTQTIPLCEQCHGKVHDRKFTNHKEMTRMGLEKAKARGVKLGKNGKKLAAANRAAADQSAAELEPLLSKCIAAGLTRGEIADTLNRQGIPTARGGKWHATTVQRMIQRLA